MLKSLNRSAYRKKDFIPAEKYDHLSDGEIIEKILAGSTPLFEVLMRRYNQRLYRIQRSYVSDEDALDDALQSTYIKAFENLDTFRGEAQFSTWITRIAINEALKHLRRRKRFTRLRLADDKQADDDQPVEGRLLNEKAAQQEQTPEDDAIQKDYKKLLETLVDRLPPKYRSVYIMRELEDMDTQETADCLGLTVANVKVRLFRARQMLQEEIKRKVSDAEIFDFMGERCDGMVASVMRLLRADSGK